MNVKIFLAAYMVVTKPETVFGDVHDLEQAVIDTGKPMIDAFEKAARLLADGTRWKDVDTSESIPTLLCKYLRAFKTWKAVDEEKLVKKLQETLAEINKLIEETKQQDQDSEQMRELKMQKKKVEKRLSQLRSTRPVVQRNRSSAAYAIKEDDDGCESEEEQEIEKKKKGTGMTNEQLAYELLLDANFKLYDGEDDEVPEENLVHTKLCRVFEGTFWNSIVQDLTSTPPSIGSVLGVLSEIRKGIVDLSKGDRSAEQIEEIVDVDHIRTQLLNESLDLPGCKKLVGDIIQVVVSMHEKMGATKRKEKTLSVWSKCKVEMEEAEGKELTHKAVSICEALKMVLNRIHKMRADAANNKLRSMAPVIRQHGIGYMQSQFQKRITAGMQLNMTEAWIRHAFDRLMEQEDFAVNIGTIQISGGNVSDAFGTVMMHATVNLVTEYPHWGGVERPLSMQDQLPETFDLNLLRVKALKNHFDADVVSVIILIQADHEIRIRVRDVASKRQLMQQVSEIVKKNPPLPTNVEKVISLVADELQPCIGDEAMHRVKKVIEKHIDAKHGVYKAIAKMIRNTWYGVLAGKQFPFGVPESVRWMEAATQEHARKIIPIFNVNMRLHVSRYNAILSETFGIKGEGKRKHESPVEGGGKRARKG